MTAQNEEKMREASKEAFVKAGYWPNEVMFACWNKGVNFAIAQGEQERKQLQLAHGLVKSEYHSAMNTNSELERKLSEQRAESQKREVELLGKYETTLTMIKDLSEQLSKYKEAKPVAYVKYRIGDFPEFLPIIAGKVRTTENLSEYVPLYDNVL